MKKDNDSEAALSILPTEDSQATRVFKLMNRLASDELKRYKREQILFFPFFVTDSQLEEFSKDILKELKNIQNTQSIDFIGSVRFEDLSSQRFDNFEQFLDRAGKRKDPESVKLSWGKFAIDGQGEAISGQVELSFITEKRLKTGRNGQNGPSQAKIEVVVSGSDQRWVDQLFDDLVPLMKTTAHGGIMRPLWVFQKDWFVGLLGGLMALATIGLTVRFGGKFYTLSNEIAARKVLATINATKNLDSKFNYYINWTLGPKPNDVLEIITVISVVVALAGFMFYLTSRYLPILTPSSAIAIGNAKRRALSAADVFKFIIVTIIFSGFIIPLIRGFISLIWAIATQ